MVQNNESAWRVNKLQPQIQSVDSLLGSKHVSTQDSTVQAYGRSSVAPRGPPLIKSSTTYFAQHENGEIVGRVDSTLGMPGRLLYPRYFNCEHGPGQLLPGMLTFHDIRFIMEDTIGVILAFPVFL